jgi:hypothetical protein
MLCFLYSCTSASEAAPISRKYVMGTVTGQGGARSSHSSHSVRYARALATCFCLNVKKLWDVGKSDREKQSEPRSRVRSDLQHPSENPFSAASTSTIPSAVRRRSYMWLTTTDSRYQLYTKDSHPDQVMIVALAVLVHKAT